MATFDLYIIPNISRTDTPYFVNKTQQDSYFNRTASTSQIISSISLSNSYYVPLFRDKIKVNVEDSSATISKLVRYNYLRLHDDIILGNSTTPFYFYYFIKNITFINESLIEMDIEMDTIQTFMFYCNVTAGVIGRKFINRFVSGAINRNYIRESFTNGKMLQKSYSIHAGNNPEEYVTICITDKIDNTTPFLSQPTYTNTHYKLCRRENNSTTWTSLTDEIVVMGDYKVSTLTAHKYNNDNTKNMIYNTAVIGGIPEVQDAYVCPFNPFIEFTINYLNDTVNDAINSEQPSFANIEFDSVNTNDGWFLGYLRQSNSWKIQDNRVFITEFSSYVSNSSTTTAFSYNLVPALIDENYYNIIFGSDNANTNYPLRYLTSTSLCCHYYLSLENGYRIYMINDISSSYTGNQALKDTYGTTVIDNNVLSLGLRNDNWKQYIARNRNYKESLAMNTATATISSLGQIAVGGALLGLGEAPVDVTQYTNYSVGKGQNFVRWGEKTTTTYGTDLPTGYGQLSSGVSGLNGVFTSLGNEAFTRDNIKNTPSEIKRQNSLSSYIDKSAFIWSRVYQVEDIDSCAMYYHVNGYKVNEPYYVSGIYPADKTLWKLINYVHTRYYYNILKMNNVFIEFNYINDILVKNDIVSRLLEGIRFWEITTGIEIGNFYYDNVELSNL